MNRALILVVLLMGGCDRPSQTNQQPFRNIHRIPIFDQIAASPKYSNEIAQAERNLPNDEWRTTPINDNVTRLHRVSEIADRILIDIKPALKGMNVSNLVCCLKVHDGTGCITNYIGDCLYPDGNRMIMSEIKSRSPSERAVLRSWPRDNAYLDLGSNGEGRGMDEVIYDLVESGTSR